MKGGQKKEKERDIRRKKGPWKGPSRKKGKKLVCECQKQGPKGQGAAAVVGKKKTPSKERKRGEGRSLEEKETGPRREVATISEGKALRKKRPGRGPREGYKRRGKSRKEGGLIPWGDSIRRIKKKG